MQPNKVELKIGGINGEDGEDYSQYVTFPVKWNSLLDVQLDEGFVSLVRCPVEIFKPLTPVYLRVYNEGSTVEYKKYFVVSSDNADEIPAGSGLWNHDLRLIENTKKLERIVCPSMGFVNPIKRNIPQISIEPVKTLYYTNNIAGVSESDLKIAGVINAPQKINKQVSFPSWTEITGVSVSNGDYTTPVYIYVLNNNLGEELRITDRETRPTFIVQSPTVKIIRYVEDVSRIISTETGASSIKSWYVDYYVTFM